jgi:hypothetical protein
VFKRVANWINWSEKVRPPIVVSILNTYIWKSIGWILIRNVKLVETGKEPNVSQHRDIEECC